MASCNGKALARIYWGKEQCPGEPMRKQSVQDKIGRMAMEKPGMNRKLLSIKKSLDEMERLLVKGEGKKKA